MNDPAPLLLAALLAAWTLTASAGEAVTDATTAGMRDGRIRPPAGVSCERDRLTSFSGVVTGYRRAPGQLRLRIDTDSGTTEAVSLDHAGDIDTLFLIMGQPFDTTDWKRIEANPGVLINGMRATAWVCASGGVPTIIDWRPDEAAPAY
jgi:hypothetical protein